jgi:hypothetical protein
MIANPVCPEKKKSLVRSYGTMMLGIGGALQAMFSGNGKYKITLIEMILLIRLI